MTTTKPTRAKIQVLREAPRRYECRIEVSARVSGQLLDHLCKALGAVGWTVDGCKTTVRAQLTQAQIRELKRLLRTWEGEA